VLLQCLVFWDVTVGTDICVFCDCGLLNCNFFHILLIGMCVCVFFSGGGGGVFFF